MATTELLKNAAGLSENDDTSALYARSVLLMRIVVGTLGVLLPTLLIILDWGILHDRLGRLKGSLSAYYHSPARDLFVGILSVLGFFLITYLFQKRKTEVAAFWLSTVAGLMVLAVAHIPTGRPGLEDDVPRCGQHIIPIPPGCTPLQQQFGEEQIAIVHFTCAMFFIGCLAALCFLRSYEDKRDFVQGERTKPRQFLGLAFHTWCGVFIVLALAWIGLGRLVDLEILGVTALYAGEVVSVYAFSGSWLGKGWELLSALNPKNRLRTLLVKGHLVHA